MPTVDPAIVIAFLSLATRVLSLLLQNETRPGRAIPVDALPDLGDWEEPDTFRARPALHEPVAEALEAARQGDQRAAFAALSQAATATGQMEARWLSNTIRTGWYVHPAVAQAALAAAQEVLQEA